MSPVFGWMIVTKRGLPVVLDNKLPIYWTRKQATAERNLYSPRAFGCPPAWSVKKVLINETVLPTKPSKKISALNIHPGWPVRKKKKIAQKNHRAGYQDVNPTDRLRYDPSL